MNEYLYLYAVLDIYREFTDKEVNTAILFQWDRDDEKTIYHYEFSELLILNYLYQILF